MLANTQAIDVEFDLGSNSAYTVDVPPRDPIQPPTDAEPPFIDWSEVWFTVDGSKTALESSIDVDEGTTSTSSKSAPIQPSYFSDTESAASATINLRGKPLACQQPGNKAPRKRIKRRSKPASNFDVPMDADNRRRTSLEKNRVAAARYRTRKKLTIEQLQKASFDKATQNIQLRNQIMELRDLVNDIKSYLLSHAHCPDGEDKALGNTQTVFCSTMRWSNLFTARGESVHAEDLDPDSVDGRSGESRDDNPLPDLEEWDLTDLGEDDGMLVW